MTGTSLRLSLFALAVSLLGCRSSAPSKTTYSYVDADQQTAAQHGVAFEDPSKVSRKTDVTKSDLAKLAKSVATAKAAYKADPTPANRTALVQATDVLASKTMDCAELTPHEKYPAALKLYRDALALDPKDPMANEASNTIIAIYKSMGRPVPQ